MNLHRPEGFLYTKHPVQREARPVVTRDPITDDGDVFGYAYTARHMPRPTPAVVPEAELSELKLVFGYAYTAHYDRIHDDRVERIAS
jgi:hypothetical protein